MRLDPRATLDTHFALDYKFAVDYNKSLTYSSLGLLCLLVMQLRCSSSHRQPQCRFWHARYPNVVKLLAKQCAKEKADRYHHFVVG